MDSQIATRKPQRSAVIAARVALATQLGITRVGLYARLDTAAPVVVKQGFAQHGLMNYWDRPAQWLLAPPATDPDITGAVDNSQEQTSSK